MSIEVNAVKAIELIPTILKAKLMPMLHGSPAIGKSAIVKQIAEEFNLKLIDIRLSQYEPQDLLGFPQIDQARQKAGYMPMETFPLAGEEVPDGYSGWLIFLDEFNSATQAVQKAAYRVTLDRQVGQHDLHDRAVCVAAGNLETDNAIVETMPTPLQSRMVHLKLNADSQVWVDWAVTHGIDYRITSFINFKPSLLYNFDPDHSDMTYASPRTWEFANRLIKDVSSLKPFTYLPLLSGTVGEGPARELLAFCRIHDQLPKMSEIKARPEEVPVSQEPSILYALSGALASHADKNNIEGLMKFINRMPPEFQVVTLREMIKRNREILDLPAIQQWASKNAKELL